MTTALIIVFVLAYVAIALEEPLKTNKSSAALIGAGVLWVIYAMAMGAPELVEPAYQQLKSGLLGAGSRLGPELVRS